jgi:hypothetical protein
MHACRKLTVCLRAAGSKFYHLGLRDKVSRSTLADANEAHDWRIFADFAQMLISIARPLYAEEPLCIEFDNALYALDSTTIDLCLNLFPLGAFPFRQSCRQDAHPARSAWQHPHAYSGHQRGCA